MDDLLLKVGKFTFSVKFYTIDMDEDRDILILLGMAFLATCGACIDIQKGGLTMRVKNEEESFGIYKSRKHARKKKRSTSSRLTKSSVRHPHHHHFLLTNP